MWTSACRLVSAAFAAFAMLALIAASPAPDLPSPAPSASLSAPAVTIFDITLTPNPVRANAQVSITIHTTPNAVVLQGRVFGHSFTVPKTGDGLFYGAGNVPWWARFFHGSINVTFTASDASGDTAQFVQNIRM
jgi:hypothetical protein